MSTEELLAGQTPGTPQEKLKGDVNAYVIIAVLVALATLSTWIVRAGVYDRVKNAATGRDVVVNGSFHNVPQKPVDPWQMLTLLQKGFIDAGSIILFILIIGGAFGLIAHTGAITSLIAKVVTLFRGKPYEKWSFVVIFAALYVMASLIGFAEAGIIFVPFIAVMALSLGYDTIVAVATVVFATALGYAGSLTGPFNVVIAQKIADLPLLSGLWFRAIASAIIFSIAATYLLRYASKVKKDPSKSLVAHIDYSSLHAVDDPAAYTITRTQARVLILFGAALVTMVVCMFRLNWQLAELTAFFLGVGVLVGLVAWMRPGDVADTFVDGAKALLYPALLVGFARGIQTILESGQVLDAMINGLVQPLSLLPTAAVPAMMVLVQSLINLIIPSSSAMAVVTMPIMTPLADLLSVQRQTAALAYQFGDGITNLILPSYSVLIGALGLAKVPFGKWFRFALPLAGILTVVVLVLITIAELIKVGPF